MHMDDSERCDPKVTGRRVLRLAGFQPNAEEGACRLQEQLVVDKGKHTEDQRPGGGEDLLWKKAGCIQCECKWLRPWSKDSPGTRQPSKLGSRLVNSQPTRQPDHVGP